MGGMRCKGAMGRLGVVVLAVAVLAVAAPAGRAFTVVVHYAGVPVVVTDPDESIEGWVPTDDGAFVVGEPQGSPGWYPVNDNPQDKATYTFRVTVPRGLTVMANGVLVRRSSAGGRTTFVWRKRLPMAPHLATATLGRFDVTATGSPTAFPSMSPSTRSCRPSRC